MRLLDVHGTPVWGVRVMAVVERAADFTFPKLLRPDFRMLKKTYGSEALEMPLHKVCRQPS